MAPPSLHNRIRDTLKGVVGRAGYSLGRQWQYRRRTSAPGAEPRTFGAWTPFFGLDTSGAHAEVFDGDRYAYKQAATMRLRAPYDDPTPNLQQGDQVREVVDDADTVVPVWAIMGVASSGPGTVAYALEREVPLMGGMDRKGGV